MQEISELVKKVVADLFNVEVDAELTRPDGQFGDYATNVAMRLSKKVGQNPREIAEKIAEELQKSDDISEAEVADPGFINLTLTEAYLAQLAQNREQQINIGKEILVEFGDPNAFKEMHIGHLYSYIVGDAIANILESSGATVHRLSYHGDVGLHVAKAIYAMRKDGLNPDSPADGVKAIGFYYAEGSKAYEEDEQAREEIHAINEHVYKKDDAEINALYEWGKEKSFKYFATALRDLEIKNVIEPKTTYYESETAEIGVKTVRANMGSVFEESDGAIVYKGEKKGLHTRVFITAKGLPTYETKDLGLAELKNRDYPSADRSIIITANEQSEYFKVMLAALSDFDKELADSITHLSHGFVNLSTGKMSSRTGKVYSGMSALVDLEQNIKEQYPNTPAETRNGAIKYHFLNHRLGSDITYDVSESFSTEGNSGPYLQYAHARARSILAKAQAPKYESQINNLQQDERSLLRKIGEYSEVVERATNDLMPHYICTYLYELAQSFNRFYENNRVIDDEREGLRLQLVELYAEKLKSGLELLGIHAPEKM